MRTAEVRGGGLRKISNGKGNKEAGKGGSRGPGKTLLTLTTAHPVPRAVALTNEGAANMAAPDVRVASTVPPSAVATAPYERPSPAVPSRVSPTK